MMVDVKKQVRSNNLHQTGLVSLLSRISSPFVQFLLNGLCFNRFCSIAFIFAVGCSSVQQVDLPVVNLYEGYPFEKAELKPVRPVLIKGDGERLYQLSAENQTALRRSLQDQSQLVQKMLCTPSCDRSCRRSALDRMKQQIAARNEAHIKQLQLRFDSLRYRVQSASNGSSTDLSEFQRHRLLVESVAEERLVLIQSYYLRLIDSCGKPVDEDRQWFLPYYTAWFRLSQALPFEVRSSL